MHTLNWHPPPIPVTPRPRKENVHLSPYCPVPYILTNATLLTDSDPRLWSSCSSALSLQLVNNSSKCYSQHYITFYHCSCFSPPKCIGKCLFTTLGSPHQTISLIDNHPFPNPLPRIPKRRPTPLPTLFCNYHLCCSCQCYELQTTAQLLVTHDASLKDDKDSL